MKEETSTDSSSNKLKHLLKNKRLCKTSNSKTNKNPYSEGGNTLTNIKKNLQNFNGYLKEINRRYQKIFKNDLKSKPKSEREPDDFEILRLFKQNMPYISGESPINLKAIQIPSNQYFMKNIFIDIIELFLENKSFPGEEKCGLVYLFKQEWIYYTIEELFYQKYISQCNKILSLAYEDFRNYKLKPDTLFTENDKYILPSSVRG